MKLGLFRVPGGNYLEGNTLDTRFAWKNTIGPAGAAARPPRTPRGGYWSTDGFGILDYLAARRGHRRPAAARRCSPATPSTASTSTRPTTRSTSRKPSTRSSTPSATPSHDVGREAGRRRAPGAVRPALRVEVGNEDWFDGSGQLRLALHATCTTPSRRSTRS